MAGEARGPAATLSRAALSALSVPYSLVMRANLAVYEGGLRGRTRPVLPVASVGNITLGGTGKTTTTRRLVRDLLTRGVRAGIVLRGHGRSAERPRELVSEGDGLLIAADVAGDEAAMLAATAPGAPIAVGKRREGAIELLAEAGAEVAVLDDGFQYFRMRREVDLVLIDATFDLTEARVFPAGYLREPLAHLRRATHLLVTHADLAPEEQTERIVAQLARCAPGTPVMRARHAPAGVYSIEKPADRRPPDALGGARVLAMCAVGNPATFEELLAGIGAEVAGRAFFPDHHAYRPEDWSRVREALAGRNVDAIAVTEKDAVKLPAAPGDLPPVVAVSVELSITDNGESWDELVSRIEQAARQEPAPAQE